MKWKMLLKILSSIFKNYQSMIITCFEKGVSHSILWISWGREGSGIWIPLTLKYNTGTTNCNISDIIEITNQCSCRLEI